MKFFIDSLIILEEDKKINLDDNIKLEEMSFSNYKIIEIKLNKNFRNKMIKANICVKTDKELFVNNDGFQIGCFIIEKLPFHTSQHISKFTKDTYIFSFVSDYKNLFIFITKLKREMIYNRVLCSCDTFLDDDLVIERKVKIIKTNIYGNNFSITVKNSLSEVIYNTLIKDCKIYSISRFSCEIFDTTFVNVVLKFDTEFCNTLRNCIFENCKIYASDILCNNLYNCKFINTHIFIGKSLCIKSEKIIFQKCSIFKSPEYIGRYIISEEESVKIVLVSTSVIFPEVNTVLSSRIKKIYIFDSLIDLRDSLEFFDNCDSLVLLASVINIKKKDIMILWQFIDLHIFLSSIYSSEVMMIAKRTRKIHFLKSKNLKNKSIGDIILDENKDDQNKLTVYIGNKSTYMYVNNYYELYIYRESKKYLLTAKKTKNNFIDIQAIKCIKITS